VWESTHVLALETRASVVSRWLAAGRVVRLGARCAVGISVGGSRPSGEGANAVDREDDDGVVFVLTAVLDVGEAELLGSVARNSDTTTYLESVGLTRHEIGSLKALLRP
jgi:hypothetical protein